MKLMSNHDEIGKDNQEELEFLVLQGCCPYCLSNQVRYREFLANLKFGFKCSTCNWRSQYTFQDFVKFSQYWLELMKPKD